MCTGRNWQGRQSNYRTINATKSGRISIILIQLTIILLICHSSHVLAIRKGRLLSPSTFTALSGDLHVQIQFNDEDMLRGFGDATSTSTTARTQATASLAKEYFTNDSISANTENIITTTSTLVISRFIDDYSMHDDATKVSDQHNSNDISSKSKSINHSSSHKQLLLRTRKEIVQNIAIFPDPRHNVTQIAIPCQTFTRSGLYEIQVVTNLKRTTVVQYNATADEEHSSVTPTITTTSLMPASDERLRQILDVRWPSAELKVSATHLLTYPDGPVEVNLQFPDVNCDAALNSKTLPEFRLELIFCGKESLCSRLTSHNVSKSNILFAEQIRGFPRLKIVQLQCELFGLAGNYAVQLRPMVPTPDSPITRRLLTVDWSDKFVFNVYARSIFPCDPHTGIGVLYEYPACILSQGDRVRVYAKLRADVASLKPPTSLHYVAEQRVVKSQYSLYFSCDLFTEKYVEYCFVYVSQAISGAVADVRVDCVPTLPVSDSDTGGWGPWSEWTPCSTNCLGGTRNRYRFCDSPPPRYGAKFCKGPSVETEKCGKPISDTWDCMYENNGINARNKNQTHVIEEIGPGCRCGCIVHLGSPKPKRLIAGATQSCPGRSFWLIQVDAEETIGLSMKFIRLPCPSQYVKVRDGASLSSTLLAELKDGSNLKIPTSFESTGAQLLVEFYAGDDVTVLSSNNATNGRHSICTGGFLASVEQFVKNRNTTLLAATRLSARSRDIKYKSNSRSEFTIVHLSAMVFASIIILISALLGTQYVVRYRKYHLAVARRHEEGSRLHTPHASMSSLHNPPSRAVSTTTLISEVIYMVKMRPKHQLRHSILRESVDVDANMSKETEFRESNLQTDAVNSIDELGSTSSIVTLRNEMVSPDTKCLNNASLVHELNADRTSSNSEVLKQKDNTKDSESIISSGMSSICNSPPLNLKRASHYSERYDAATLKLRTSFVDDSMNNCDSMSSTPIPDSGRLSQIGLRCASISLINACYSPAASVISTATIRTTNPKESKEKQNLRRLLARPGSEFSLGNQEDLELDYYDYNVINAAAAPGSYLGMDPAHLIWVPPLEEITDGGHEHDADKTPEPTQEPDETEPLYEEIKMPKYGHYLSPHSNTESSTNTTSTTSPTSDELSPLNTTTSSSVAIHNPAKQSILHSYRDIRERQEQIQEEPIFSFVKLKKGEKMPLHELSSSIKLSENGAVETNATTSLSDSMTGSYVEKETSVVKSPSDLRDFLTLDDIQFADESESEHDTSTNTYDEHLSMETTPLKNVQKDISNLSENRRQRNVKIYE